MNPWAQPKLGCFGWLILVALCGWPLHALGAGDTVSIVGGIVISSVVLIASGEMYRRARIKEIRDAHSDLR